MYGNNWESKRTLQHIQNFKRYSESKIHQMDNFTLSIALRKDVTDSKYIQVFPEAKIDL